MVTLVMKVNENLRLLQEQLLQFFLQQYSDKLRPQIEYLIDKISAAFQQVAASINELKFGKITAILLDVLTEIETILISIKESVELSAIVTIADGALYLTAILKKQIAAIDIERQKYVVFQ